MRRESVVRVLAIRGMHVLVVNVDGEAVRRVAGEVRGTGVTADLLVVNVDGRGLPAGRTMRPNVAADEESSA
jgi:hypothetical protein